MLPVVLIALLIAGWNNALHLAPARRREFAVVAGVTTAAVAGGAWLSTWVDLSAGALDALPWAAATMTAGGLLALVARVAPRVGKSLADQRIVGMSRVRFVVHTALRIPLVSGLAEEILFRGLMWALLAPLFGTWWTLAVTSVAFGLWHVVVSAQQARRIGVHPPKWVTVNVLATLVAGFLLGLLRVATGGVWAPAAVHALVNVAVAVASRIGAAHQRQALVPVAVEG